MNRKAVMQWATQVTTGVGVIIGLPAFVVMASGRVPWRVGWPALLAAAVGVFWPERAGLPAAVLTLAEDINTVLFTLERTNAQMTSISRRMDAAVATFRHAQSNPTAPSPEPPTEPPPPASVTTLPRPHLPINPA